MTIQIDPTTLYVTAAMAGSILGIVRWFWHVVTGGAECRITYAPNTPEHRHTREIRWSDEAWTLGRWMGFYALDFAAFVWLVLWLREWGVFGI